METGKTYSVTELTRNIKITLEDKFYLVWVQGEISNFKKHSSGHYYFSLKDENAQLNAAMWKGKTQGLNFLPQDGMKVVAGGKITLFEKAGRYQLDVSDLQPLGIGELQLAFEQLKVKLQEEGLFDSSHKKSLPQFPEKIGIVTSPTGAAIRDIKSVIARRFPGVQMIIRPANVQGDGAAEEIAKAIEEFNEYGKVDVMIVGRGGGSLEDLWAFNEEIVARAIFNSDIPIISAVGHEIDFTIADFVADRRAPTPSAAGEMVVMNAEELMEGVNSRIKQIYNLINSKLKYLVEKMSLLEGSRAFSAPFDLLKQYSLQLDLLNSGLEKVHQEKIKSKLDYIEQLEKRLQSLAPESVLKRGYSVTYGQDKETIVYDSKSLSPGDKIHVKFYKGSAEGTIDSTKN